MANVGLPSGFPSRPEMGANLRPYVGNVRSIGANRGSKKFDALSSLYQDAAGQYLDDNYGQTTQYAPPDAQDMVMLTDIPTSSTNYSRPRTVAAGYDPNTKTMTVVFRDGTFYNYYDVSAGEWENFSASYSKGRPWLNRKNSKQAADGLFIGKQRGPADVSAIDPAIREQLYRVSRAQQLYQKPKPHKAYSYSHPNSSEPQLRTAKSGGKIPTSRRTGYAPKRRKTA